MKIKGILGLGALALATTIVSPVMQAQCGAHLTAIKPSSWSPGITAAHRMLVAQWGEHGRDGHDGRAEEQPIVGMWHVTFTAKKMNGNAIPDTVIDDALAVWHADKTEIMNSGRPPQDGNFCMGVWEQESERTYRLNHFAWGANNYAPGTPDGVVGPKIGGVHYTETVTVGPAGKHFTGAFTLQQYDTSGNLVLTFTGALAATRITIDTKPSDLL